MASSARCGGRWRAPAADRRPPRRGAASRRRRATPEGTPRGRGRWFATATGRHGVLGDGCGGAEGTDVDAATAAREPATPCGNDGADIRTAARGRLLRPASASRATGRRRRSAASASAPPARAIRGKTGASWRPRAAGVSDEARSVSTRRSRGSHLQPSLTRPSALASTSARAAARSRRLATAPIQSAPRRFGCSDAAGSTRGASVAAVHARRLRPSFACAGDSVFATAVSVGASVARDVRPGADGSGASAGAASPPSGSSGGTGAATADARKDIGSR